MANFPKDTNGRWIQLNDSDKRGSLWYTKNVDLDEVGKVKLSARSVAVYNETEDNRMKNLMHHVTFTGHFVRFTGVYIIFCYVKFTLKWLLKLTCLKAINL